jgi:hypothetical protein
VAQWASLGKGGEKDRPANCWRADGKLLFLFAGARIAGCRRLVFVTLNASAEFTDALAKFAADFADTANAEQNDDKQHD